MTDFTNHSSFHNLPPIGKNYPHSFNVMIEIGASSSPVKYEIDKHTGLLFVDRFMPTSMIYPCNYGFIPNTLAGDGDPVDVLVHSTYPIISGAVIEVRPIGVLLTEDEKGEDAKLLCLPLPKADQMLASITSYKDFPEIFLSQIQHFFERYKELEKGKWVKILGWKDAEIAKQIILDAVERNGKGIGCKD